MFRIERERPADVRIMRPANTTWAGPGDLLGYREGAKPDTCGLPRLGMIVRSRSRLFGALQFSFLSALQRRPAARGESRRSASNLRQRFLSSGPDESRPINRALIRLTRPGFLFSSRIRCHSRPTFVRLWRTSLPRHRSCSHVRDRLLLPQSD